jgi:formamidopyrimidine-DNA glycosylase
MRDRQLPSFESYARLHFGMTGFLRYFKGEEKAPRHTRVLFVFEKDRCARLVSCVS